MPKKLNSSTGLEIIQPPKQFKVLVIGETCVDKYVYGECSRISPEAPVPVMEYIETKESEGMAWNVRSNLLSFGCNVYIMTNELKPKKTRYVDRRSNQQIMRLDEDDEVADFGWELPVDDYPSNYTKTNHNANPLGQPFDALVISDYNKGYLSEEKIFELVEWFDGPVFIDSKKTKLPKKDCFIKINHTENKKLKGRYKNLIVTHGSDGAIYKDIHYEGFKVPTFDVSGAGDTFLAALTYYYLLVGSIEKALPYSNKAASIAVEHPGTYILTGEDVNEIQNLRN